MADKIKQALEKLGADETVLTTEIDDDTLIAELQGRGFRVDKPEPVERRVKLAPLKTKRFRLGVISDTHLGSKFQQRTWMCEFFDEFEREVVDSIVHVGDLVHGTHKMHRGMEYEIFTHGADAQIDYAVDAVPKVSAPAFIISGNHDKSFWNDAGTDVVETFCDRRDDWEYLGSEGAYLEVGGASVYLWHGGRKAYAKSYPLQKWAEAVSPEAKPHIMMNGHLHHTCHVLHRNVECFQLPCTQAMTPFEKKLGLSPEIGALILDLWVSKHGLEDIQTKWLRRKRVIENDW